MSVATLEEGVLFIRRLQLENMDVRDAKVANNSAKFKSCLQREGDAILAHPA